jgi:hypothetical protein
MSEPNADDPMPKGPNFGLLFLIGFFVTIVVLAYFRANNPWPLTQ